MIATHIPPPQELTVLRENTPDLISYKFFIDACYAFGHWQIACGVDPATLQHPDTYVTEADLERFVDVVSRWPVSAPQKLRKPNLEWMVYGIRVQPNEQPKTFAQGLDVFEGNIVRWMLNNKVDPGNPNETREERKARLNRDRVRAHRLRNLEADSGDAVKDALVADVRQLALSVQKGKAWAKVQEANAKRVRDEAIEAAKARCASTISGAKAAVASEEQKLAVAQAELESYDIRK